jgi:hypothetical protein
VICAECKREIAEGSQSCPVCGAPVSLQRSVIVELPTGLPDDAVEWHSSSSMAAEQPPQDAPAWKGLAASKSRRGALVVAGMAAAGVVAVILGIGLAAQSSSPARRPTAWTRQLTVDQLRPGDCLTGSDLGLGTGSAWPYTVTAVPYIQRHLAEITFAGNLWPAALATCPGDGAVNNMVDDRCQSALYAYAGQAQQAQPALTYDSVAPSGGVDWSSGDRKVVCMAYEPGIPLQRSVKATRK